MTTLTETIRERQAEAMKWDAGYAAGAAANGGGWFEFPAFKSEAHSRLERWTDAATSDDEALLALEVAAEEAEAGSSELIGAMATAAYKWFKAKRDSGEKDGHVVHSFAESASDGQPALPDVMRILDRVSRLAYEMVDALDELDDGVYVTVYPSQKCSHPVLRMAGGDGRYTIAAPISRPAEPICDRVGRLSYALADALNDYQGGQFYAAVWPSATNSNPAVLFGSRSSRFLPEILDRMSAA